MNPAVVDTPTEYPLEFQPGECWTVPDRLVAVVLEANEYAVIFQDKISEDENEMQDLDFVSGQTLYSVQRFQDHLKKNQALKTLAPNPKRFEAARLKYFELKHSGKIIDPKNLPRTEEEAANLSVSETFLYEKKIVPPPPQYLNTKAFHWLKAGLSGSHFVCKLWDPHQWNWVFPNGLIDPTGALGFVKQHHCLAMIVEEVGSEETLESFSARLVTFLKRNRFLFDSEHLLRQMKKLGENETLVKDGKLPTFTFTYHVLPGVSDDGLIVNASLGDEMKLQVFFDGVVNREFIPNNEIRIWA